jgi:hypothetical protein
MPAALGPCDEHWEVYNPDKAWDTARQEEAP